jgi:hypothetical protein
MSSLIIFRIFLLFVYQNSMFFTLYLLSVAVFVLTWLVLSCFVTALIGLIITIIYIGAMIILIIYVCAVSPNLYLEPDYTFFWGFFSCIVFVGLFVVFFPTALETSVAGLESYFYSVYGVGSFLFCSLMLFLVLLMVTSQSVTPRGPFRSV